MSPGAESGKYAIEEKWQRRWADAGLFNSEPDHSRKKFFINFPYPYMNGYLHVGHTFSLVRCEIFARYKRMRGYNTLFPFAFHCTGTPIVAAAKRIEEKEPTQVKILKDIGIAESEVEKFRDPVHWTKYFPVEAKKDLQALGVAVDWRRTFITTRLNPFYDRFIKWQFNKLRQKGFVALGDHPVIWCPKDNMPVGDHGRSRGEGETPTEFTLLKFRFEGDDEYLVAATLRPETVYGQTNMWVEPELSYVRARIDGKETWIVSRECAEKLSSQGKAVDIIGKITGREMLGKSCLAPGIEREIVILPSQFCDPKKGTGLVTSVPSDAPDDWMGLYDLQKDENISKKYGLDWEKLKAIKPVAIIESDQWGALPAVKICETMGIESQSDRKNLEKAKKEIYKSGFYSGVLTKECKEYSGKKVEWAKEEIKQKLLLDGKADVMYEPSGDVVCRCLTPCIVKLVTNQWFLTYSDPEWKGETYRALSKMKLFPETSRKQFEYVIGWLRDWACTREFGLGTSLPWDEKWIVESLSDSTIYMAYYTISKYLEFERAIDIEMVDDELFDYVFLGNGDASTLEEKMGVCAGLLSRMRDEFLYWYPYDLRGSGKDLIQNHLTFSIFNHVAIFGEDMAPRGFGVNGWILVDGAKMSKSTGNFYTLREVLTTYGADALRFSLMYGGEGMDDPNWDTEFAATAGKRLNTWLEFAVNNYNTGREKRQDIDEWFESVLSTIVESATVAMESMNFRSALKVLYFDLQAAFKWYQRRCVGEWNRTGINRYIETQTKLLAPFTPHLCEEIWEKIGRSKDGDEFISSSSWPSVPSEKESKTQACEAFLKDTIGDIHEILKITNMAPKRIVIYTAPEWKRKMARIGLALKGEGSLNVGAFMKRAMEDGDIKGNAKLASKMAPKMVNDLTRASEKDAESLGLVDEKTYLESARDFLSQEFACRVDIFSAGDKDVYDPKSKGKQAMPLRPAIYIE